MAPRRATSSRARSGLADLGRCFGADLYEREVAYLMRAEWAQRGDDVLWRRTKLGLRLGAAERQALDDYMLAQLGATGDADAEPLSR